MHWHALDTQQLSPGSWQRRLRLKVRTPRSIHRQACPHMCAAVSRQCCVNVASMCLVCAAVREKEEAEAARAARSSSDEWESQRDTSDEEAATVASAAPTVEEEEQPVGWQQDERGPSVAARRSSMQSTDALTFVMQQAKAAVDARRANDPGTLELASLAHPSLTLAAAAGECSATSWVRHGRLSAGCVRDLDR